MDKDDQFGPSKDKFIDLILKGKEKTDLLNLLNMHKSNNSFQKFFRSLRMEFPVLDSFYCLIVDGTFANLRHKENQLILLLVVLAGGSQCREGP